MRCRRPGFRGSRDSSAMRGANTAQLTSAAEVTELRPVVDSAPERRLPGRVGFQEQVDDQQLAVEMGLDARAITVRQVLTAEVNFD